MEKNLEKKKRTHRGLKMFGIIASVLVVITIGSFLYLATHTQAVVGILQKISYTGKPLNSYEPLNEPYKGLKENGQYLISEINYGSDYPNSYLDIIYPNENLEENRPTLFYFHGGGFFAGSKNMGDPLAENEATYLIDDICAQGYNIVNVDYVLVPEGQFPDPLTQMNEAFSFIMEHGEEYHLNTNSIILMGSSAGAIIAAQMATAISNDEYAELLGISPILNTNQICAVVVDDGPLDYESFTLECKVLIGNYVKGSIFLNKDELNRYDCIPHMTKDYPETVLLGSEYRYDMKEMHDKLNELNVENILIDPYAENGVEKPHCFVSLERDDPIAKDAFERMKEYLNKKSKSR